MLNFLIQASLMKAYTGRKMQKNAKQDRMRKLYLFYIRTVVLSFLPDLKVYTSLPSPSYGLHRPWCVRVYSHFSTRVFDHILLAASSRYTYHSNQPSEKSAFFPSRDD